MNALAKAEATELRECEEVIQRGLSNFIEVGNALMKIRDAKLYRAEFKTFEDYCREKWGMTRMRASQLIGASKVIANVNHGLQTCGRCGKDYDGSKWDASANGNGGCPSTERPRRCELLKAGKIIDSGLTRATRSGRSATVWRAA